MSERIKTATVNRAAPVAGEGLTYASISQKVSHDVLRSGFSRGWLIGFAVAFLLVMVLFWAIAVLFMRGVGIWGIDIPVAWGFAITNFVWWIGIGHAGTLISAILLLLHQEWRTSINRFAEAMTLFAIACAGMFPLLHLGRPHKFYYMIPYPDTMNLWPQFRSALIWDFFAIMTYGIVSLLFWYVGLIPSLATVRDKAKSGWRKRIFALMALGWRGDARHWFRFRKLYLVMAGLATPLVVSVHSIVSFDFAITIVPGWHSEIFGPYFVAGAIFSGFAMVLTIAIPLRKAFGLEEMITMRHLDSAAKVLLATGLIVAYGYFNEYFIGWYGHNQFERYVLLNRLFGPYAWTGWLMLACNVVAPQVLWFRGVRRNVAALFVVSIVVNIGMWTERFVIVVTSLHRDFMPSAWGMFYPTVWDWATLAGSLGLFAALFYLFVRFFPIISIDEMKKLVRKGGTP